MMFLNSDQIRIEEQKQRQEQIKQHRMMVAKEKIQAEQDERNNRSPQMQQKVSF